MKGRKPVPSDSIQVLGLGLPESYPECYKVDLLNLADTQVSLVNKPM